MLKNAVKVVCAVALVVYLLVLAKLIVFKFPDTMMQGILSTWSPDSVRRQLRAANLIPFKTISSAVFSPQLRIEVTTLIYNIIAFVPLGVIVPLLSEKVRKWGVMLLIGLLVSLGFEVVQLVTTLGLLDIDDVILNVTGTMIGYGCFKIAFSVVSHYANPRGESVGEG